MEGARYLEDGRLTIFKRSGVYYARIRLSASGRYIWRSLQTTDEQTAIRAGRRLLFQLEQRADEGLPPKSKPFSAVIDDYIRYRERDHQHGKTSAGMLRQIIRVAKFWREDLSLNYTTIRTAKPNKFKKVADSPIGFVVEKKPSWLGALDSIITSGSQKIIEHLDPDIRALIKELRKDPVGYLVVTPRLLGMIVSRYGAELLNEIKVSECILFAESADPAVVQAARNQGIPVRSSYSCEEVGQIAFECATCEGHYHVTTSNVIVEVVDVSHEVGGAKLGRVLVTHLHSYATPFIRYDMGDLALLKDACPCGHSGPTLHKLYGRATNALKRRDGTLHSFYIRGPDLLEVVQFSEFRIRQVDFDALVIELGGRKELSPEEVQNVVQFLKARAGEDFKVEVIPRTEIDWGESLKRQSFRCEV